MYIKNTYEQAVDLIEGRRKKNVLEYEKRTAEIYEKFPAIAAYNEEFAQVSLSVLKLAAQSEQREEGLRKLKERNAYARRQIEQILVREGYPADYLQMRFNCGHCGDSGFANGKQCICLKNLITESASKELNREAGIHLKTFDEFKIEYYAGWFMREFKEDDGIGYELSRTPKTGLEPCAMKMRAVVNELTRYAAVFSPKQSGNILFFGKTGTGKTHLAGATAERVIKQGYVVLYDTAANFLRTLEHERFNKNSEGEPQLWENIMTADLLVLDGLGMEQKGSASAASVFNIIDSRLNLARSTIITTGLSRSERLSRYGEALASRLEYSYKQVFMPGDDNRRKVFGTQ